MAHLPRSAHRHAYQHAESQPTCAKLATEIGGDKLGWARCSGDEWITCVACSVFHKRDRRHNVRITLDSCGQSQAAFLWRYAPVRCIGTGMAPLCSQKAPITLLVGLVATVSPQQYRFNFVHETYR